MILGMTESGKSCLAKRMASDLVKANQTVIIVDPIDARDWAETNVDTQYPRYFKDVVSASSFLQSNRNCFVFIDECGDHFSAGYDRGLHWLATRSRHYGHSVTFIAQRAVQIPPTMRDQCSRLWLFTSSNVDGKIHAQEWNKPHLEQCNMLPQFHCYHVDRFAINKRYRIVDYNKIEPFEETPKKSRLRTKGVAPEQPAG